MGGSSVEVSILGSSFTVQSRYDPRFLGEVIAYLKDKIREIRGLGYTANVPARSRGTAISTGPSSVSSVLGLVPLRQLSARGSPPFW